MSIMYNVGNIMGRLNSLADDCRRKQARGLSVRKKIGWALFALLTIRFYYNQDIYGYLYLLIYLFYFTYYFFNSKNVKYVRLISKNKDALLFASAVVEMRGDETLALSTYKDITSRLQKLKYSVEIKSKYLEYCRIRGIEINSL